MQVELTIDVYSDVYTKEAEQLKLLIWRTDTEKQDGTSKVTIDSLVDLMCNEEMVDGIVVQEKGLKTKIRLRTD